MTELVVGAFVWLAILVVLSWALRRRDHVGGNEPDQLLRFGAGAFTRRPTPPPDEEDEDVVADLEEGALDPDEVVDADPWNEGADDEL